MDISDGAVIEKFERDRKREDEVKWIGGVLRAAARVDSG